MAFFIDHDTLTAIYAVKTKSVETHKLTTIDPHHSATPNIQNHDNNNMHHTSGKAGIDKNIHKNYNGDWHTGYHGSNVTIDANLHGSYECHVNYGGTVNWVW